MTEKPGGPSKWLRVVGIIGTAYLVVYSAIGLWHNDLFVSLGKSGGDGVHLHGLLAWLCFAGVVMFSVGLVGLVAPELGAGEYDIAARRRRFGPILLAGLLFYAASQVIAGWRS